MLARRVLRLLPLATIVLAALSCSPRIAHATAGARASRILIKKQEHTMQLLTNVDAAGKRVPEHAIATYSVAIGPGGSGFKKQEGDKVTPVGRYHVTAHQPSQFKVFLRLDYPNAEDHRRFRALKESGALPKDATIGGDIGIHGPPVKLPSLAKSGLKLFDWTLGCIAVDEDEIAEIAAMVKDGTPVDIED